MSRLQPRLEILQQIESVQTKLERLTICWCGAPVLPHHISVGTEYIVFPATEVDDGYYRCARCGIEQRDIRLIDAIPVSSPNASPMPLPRDLFPAGLEAEDPPESAVKWIRPELLQDVDWRDWHDWRLSPHSFSSSMTDTDIMRFIERDILKPRPTLSVMSALLSHKWKLLMGLMIFAFGGAAVADFATRAKSE